MRAELSELDDRLHGSLDYRDREPVGGTFQNRPMRLLYKGEVGYELVEDRLTLSLGRFMAPALTLTPVDGLRADLESGDWALAAYGGRRGFSQSRRNLPLDAMLPAFGASVSRTTQRLQLIGLGGWSQDRVILLGAEEPENDVGAGHAMATVSALPVDDFRFGGQAAFHQQITYLLGPTWSDLGIEVTAMDLWRGLIWADWEARDWLNLAVDVHHQELGAFGTGSIDSNDVLVELQDPRFTDLRGEADVGLWKRGWIRPLGRYRIRHDRQELRFGSAFEVNDFGVAGPFVAGKLFFDEVSGAIPDRLIWSASGGYERGDIEVEAGASFIEREAAPFGSRRLDGESAEDLNPFVLEAQQLAFVRGFYSADRWFAGIDLERSLKDPEVRVFVQVGALGEVRW